MSGFDEREKSFEAKFKQDQELQFKVKARRNKLLGLWAAGKLGLSGAAADAYAKEVVRADFEAPGDDDVLKKVFGDLKHKMANVTGVWIPEGVNGDRVRKSMLEDFNIEIGTSFGPLHGRIWRFGNMGYNARQDAVLLTLAALETVLSAEGHRFGRGARRRDRPVPPARRWSAPSRA